MKRMYRRTAIFFAILMLTMFLSILSVFTVSTGTDLAQTAAQQSSYEITVLKTRGTIYDGSLRPMTGDGVEYAAAVAPTVEAAAALTHVLSQEEMAEIYPGLTSGKPFVLRLPRKISAEGIDLFETRQRYASHQLAAHTIGYLNGEGHGVSGIERAFDQVLTEDQGEIKVHYQVDALNRALAGESVAITDTSEKERSGVVLTLDGDVQRIAEEAAHAHLKKGAVVVTEVPSCQIRALVSLPDFDPGNVAEVLDDSSAPLLNRTISAYSVGSVFKLVSAAAALQYGISPATVYECTGGIEVDGAVFHCIDGEAHGKVDMKGAVSKSCNCYFVHLMQQVPQQQFLLMAQNMGFGMPTELAPGCFSQSGSLPTLKSLHVRRALANFSFGQGDFTATPVQIAGMINTIASGGYYTPPGLYQGLVDENLQYTARARAGKSVPVISENTASLIRSFMVESVEHGSSRRFRPKSGGAGAKTATAQTGRMVDGVEAVESWVAGFYPAENPKYAITVLGEEGTGGGATCGPVFKEIADSLADLEKQSGISDTGTP